jgi:hypothetical protein
MNRSAFFTTIAAFLSSLWASAQTTIIPCQPRLQFGAPMPPNCNGQCPNPTCAYMAPPWTAGQGHSQDQPLVMYVGSPMDWNPVPVSRIVRCPKCSTAFWQDPS